MIKVNGFNLKGFKSMEGHDGYIMRGTLMKNGKAVTDFFDDGYGGGMCFEESNKRLEPLINEVFALYNKNGLINLDEKKDEKFYKSFILENLVNDVAGFQDSVKDARKLAKKHGTKDAIVVATVCDYEGFSSIVYVAFASKIFFNQKKFEKEYDFGFYKFKKILSVVEGVCNTNVDAKLF